MLSKRRIAALLLCALLLTNLPARAQTPSPAPSDAAQTPQRTPAQPTPTPTDVDRIKDEALNRSQVMQTLSYLTDVIGPRLTNSPGMKRANEWTRDRLTSWGLQNAKLEAWGPFGRGWTLKHFSAEVSEPHTIPLVAYPKAWSPGLASTLSAEVVYIDATKEEELAKYKGQLRGKIVLTSPLREVKAHFDAEALRMTEKQLLDLANAPDPATRPARAGRQQTPEQRAAAAFATRRLNFLHEEGAALLVDPGRGDGGNLFVSGVTVPQPAPSPTPATPLRHAFDSASHLPLVGHGRAEVRAPNRPRRRALQPPRAHDSAGRARPHERQPRRRVSGQGLDGLQHGRGDTGHRFERRSSHARRAPRLLARRDGRDRQRRRMRRRDGSRSHPQGFEPSAAPHHSHRFVERRGARSCSARALM